MSGMTDALGFCRPSQEGAVQKAYAELHADALSCIGKACIGVAAATSALDTERTSKANAEALMQAILRDPLASLAKQVRQLPWIWQTLASSLVIEFMAMAGECS
jgi:hypothetical protein